MAIIEIEVYKFLDGLNSEYIVIESSKINDYIKYIQDNKIKAIYLSNLYFFNKEIDFLQKCNFIEKLNITSTSIENYDGLKYLKNLKELSLDEPKGKVRLEQNRILEKLSIEINKNIIGINELKYLKILNLWNYKPKSKDLNEIGLLQSIEELKIYKSPIESLNGCGNLVKLKKLELGYLNKLYYISELEKIKNSLKNLEFLSCKNIVNHDYVTCLDNLEKLSYNKCGDIETISFISKMPNLKSFVFMDTNIVDGDLEPCTRLKYVAFQDKKHYSHKNSDFN